MLERVVVVHAGRQARDMSNHRIKLEFVHAAPRRIRAGQKLLAVTGRTAGTGTGGAIQQFGKLFDGDRIGIVEGAHRYSIFDHRGEGRVASAQGR
ncbi:Uncharacterised protein [Mycobacteroides abscessus subsp. abscessus]|nr:Uncharacterised protein [Mycobacteroides abscessus subsp. abscessus]